MIIKKSELKILPAKELSQGFASKFNFEEEDASLP